MLYERNPVLRHSFDEIVTPNTDIEEIPYAMPMMENGGNNDSQIRYVFSVYYISIDFLGTVT